MANTDIANAQTVNVFNSSAVVGVPPGVSSYTVECWGGGGGGGSSLTNIFTCGGSGGGGGAFSRKVLSVLPGQTYTVTVGAGGTGGLSANHSAGTGGGTTSFTGPGGACSAAGGSGGGVSCPGTPAAGGSSGNGFLYSGGDGGAGSYTNPSGNPVGGGGGGGAGNAGGGFNGNLANGGQGGTGSPNTPPYQGGYGGSDLSSTATPIGAGGTPGGGGAGGCQVTVNGNNNGYAGSAGRVVLTYSACTTPTITATVPAARCGTGTVTLSATASAGSIKWYAGPTGGSPLGTGPSFTTPSISSNTTYYVDATDDICISSPRTPVPATVNTIPVVTASSSATTICAGQSITLSGSGANSYSWSGGATNGIAFFPTASATYTVTGTDLNNCSDTSTIYVQVSSIITPSICAVTVDSLSDYNIIVWDKTAYMTGDTFMVYRDTANNNYALIGKVPYDSLSWFTDTVRTLYAANGDPNASTWKYKIAVKDSCGNLSLMSPFHKSLFIQNNSGNFSWNDYLIEGQPVPVPALSNYLFQRDNLSNGTWVTIQTLSASSLAYTDVQYPAYQATATWRVKTLWSINCNATIKYPNTDATNLNTSRSNNYKGTAPTAVNALTAESSIRISPNPAGGEFVVSGLPASVYSLEVYDIYGEKVFSHQNPEPNSLILNIEMPNGIYFLKVSSDKGTACKKLVVQK